MRRQVKSAVVNRITIIPELLELLVLNNCIVTIDAMGCQTKIAKQIVEAEAGYVLMIKDNQSHLHYISSLSNDAKKLLHAIRGHWRVENSLHWVLDVAMGEDDSRVRKGYGPQNLGLLRRLALSLLKQEETAKVGIKAKQRKAGWDEDYLLKVLVVA